MVDYIDYMVSRIREKRRILENLEDILIRIRDISRQEDPEARVLLFGSIVEGRFRPDSDIDILIISGEAGDPMWRARLRMKIYREVGGREILELHIVTPKEYEDWFKRFIKNSYIEVVDGLKIPKPKI